MKRSFADSRRDGVHELTLLTAAPWGDSVLNLGRLREAHDAVAGSLAVHCHAMAVLPNRIHMLWSLATDGRPLSEHLSDIETAFDEKLTARPSGSEGSGCVLRARVVPNERELQRRIDACHFAPVRHGLTRRPEDWPHSTVRSKAPSELILT